MTRAVQSDEFTLDQVPSALKSLSVHLKLHSHSPHVDFLSSGSQTAIKCNVVMSFSFAYDMHYGTAVVFMDL